MLWVLVRREKHYREDHQEKARMDLAEVYRFLDADAAMRRFGWTTQQLGQAQTGAGLTFTGASSLRHTFTTAHAMPETAMLTAENGFTLVLHAVRDGKDYVRTWELPPGREEIMTAVEYDA